MKRNQLYAELLKMGLSWSVNTFNNPCGKDRKTETEQPRQFSGDLSWTSHAPAVQLTQWPFLFPKRTTVMSILYISVAAKGRENYYQLLFYSNARPQGLLLQWCS